MQRQRVDLHFLARHADQDAAAFFGRQVVAKLDQMLDAGGLDHLVDAGSPDESRIAAATSFDASELMAWVRRIAWPS